MSAENISRAQAQSGLAAGEGRQPELGSGFDSLPFASPYGASNVGDSIIADEAIAPASAHGTGAFRTAGGASPVQSQNGGNHGLGVSGITRSAPPVRERLGRGPIGHDPRRFKYDRLRGRAMGSLPFGASRADRMDPGEAGEMLNRIHVAMGIDKAEENRIVAFDNALFFEHTINGASLMQPGRGVIYVGESAFELAPIKAILGAEQRRFFRAFADDIVVVNRAVIAQYDPYDHESVDQYGQLMQIAVERGLQKYPYLAHDSADACVRISVEERKALMASKNSVIPSASGASDEIAKRVDAGAVKAKQPVSG